MDEEPGIRQRHPTAPPPSYEECIRSTEPEVPSLSQDDARKALLRFVQGQWFANKAPAIEFDFVDIQSSSAYRYELQTFTESRSVSWVYTPFTGQRLDYPQLGTEPDMWSVEVFPAAMFVEEERRCEVAHTASQVTCHDCLGATYSQCWMCKGSGGVRCAPCRGCGQVTSVSPPHQCHHPHPPPGGGGGGGGGLVSCGVCRGVGAERCSTCQGKGQIVCEKCCGAGRLKKFKELTVQWKVHSVDRVVELTGLDHKCIRKAKARTLMQEESLQAEPIRDFPIPCMRLASEELTASSSFPNSKRLMQRQTMLFVPVHLVTGRWKERQFSYWVYGYDSAAHCTEYPGNKCDCNCTLL